MVKMAFEISMGMLNLSVKIDLGMGMLRLMARNA
jgi:hypothetical protein